MVASSPPRSFTETLAFEELGENQWQTIHPPQRMGNAANIAYGGFAVSVAAKAACLSVPDSYHLYTLMGNFLGPALTDRPLRASTRPIRKTRTFATCQVEVSQLQDNGESRPCLVALADFQVKEKGVLLEYSAPPRLQYSHWKDCLSAKDRLEKMLREGKISPEMAARFKPSFGMADTLFESRHCPEGIAAQNLMGLAKSLPTTQDALPLTQKSTADWSRCRSGLPSATDNIAAVAFLMDGAISFAPLMFSRMFLGDSKACSSLDFALRVFRNEVQFEEWHLREIVTHVGAEGRTYSESRLWDEGGACVACMTQQSILRPWGEEKGNERGKL
ncbi:acyl-CoA thioesterase II [Trematosphaeria pertusa]|uniref:Acyl-CoA thioesterase II n=1 Tax=Trematosphaeria pertusa TaxID=390896 RepID=A0A6A6IE87_9PLEO|nr:acyl-CoA thioesterase II [Trematosphaeria pertusa]KAF2247880.1 acyl-CoA thioesterase II [Trematosphaeria pertusa]